MSSKSASPSSTSCTKSHTKKQYMNPRICGKNVNDQKLKLTSKSCFSFFSSSFPGSVVNAASTYLEYPNVTW